MGHFPPVGFGGTGGGGRGGSHNCDVTTDMFTRLKADVVGNTNKIGDNTVLVNGAKADIANNASNITALTNRVSQLEQHGSGGGATFKEFKDGAIFTDDAGPV